MPVDQRSEYKYLPWIVGGMLVLFLYVFDFQASKNGVIDHHEIWGRDFINMWTGGKLIAARDFGKLYDPTAFMAYQESLYGPLDRHIFSYPPVTFVLADLLARLPYPVALLAWLGGTGALFFHAARPWWPKDGSWPILAIVTPSALLNIWEGQYGFLVGALFLYGWRWLDTRPWAAGIAIGLLIIKPQFAVLIPLVLLLRREWRTILSAAVTIVAMILLSITLYGLSAWTTFFALGAGRQALIDAGGAFFGKLSSSAATAVLAIGGGWPLAIAAQIVLAVIGLVMVFDATGRKAPTRELALLVATCTFLVLPYGLSYDLTVVTLAAWTVMTLPNITSTDRTLAMLGFVAPQLGIVFALLGIPVMPLMLVGLAIAQYRIAIGQHQPAQKQRRWLQ
ncbi:MAG: glycosyltransferase family 87 protein [Sphingobium sp.]